MHFCFLYLYVFWISFRVILITNSRIHFITENICSKLELDEADNGLHLDAAQQKYASLNITPITIRPVCIQGVNGDCALKNK